MTDPTFTNYITFNFPPKSLAEEALARVRQYKNDFMPPLEKDWEVIRRALERLQQLEDQQ